MYVNMILAFGTSCEVQFCDGDTRVDVLSKQVGRVMLKFLGRQLNP